MQYNMAFFTLHWKQAHHFGSPNHRYVKQYSQANAVDMYGRGYISTSA